jgi:hypothetical protein
MMRFTGTVPAEKFLKKLREKISGIYRVADRQYLVIATGGATVMGRSLNGSTDL